MSKEIDLETVRLLFEVKKNQLKMLRNRGYDISKEEKLLSITLQDFINSYIPFAKQQKKTFREVLKYLYTNDEGDRLLVYFTDVKFGKDEVIEVINTMEKYKTRNSIVISPKKLSPVASKEIDGLYSYNIEIFLEEELSYDPTEHILVPEHIPLSNDEQRDFLERNGLNLSQLPYILTTDRIVRYYGLKPGRIVKIIRTNIYDTMVKKSISYRAVTEP